MARRIEVELVGDSRSLERAFKRSERSAKNFNGTMAKTKRGLGRGAGGGLLGLGAGAAAAAGISQSVKAASDFEQQMAKVGTVFGESAGEVEAWSETTTKAFGLSERQALATAGSFGALFKPIGLVGPEAAKQAKALTELGADLASFYNTDVQSALDAVRSGLVGESEPLRRYGVLLSETRVQQVAMADSGKKNAKALTLQEKAAARIKIIFEDAATATGDFARTSDDLAQQTKVAEANLDNLKVQAGSGLVPVLADAAKMMNRLVDAYKRLPKQLRAGPGDLVRNLANPPGFHLTRTGFRPNRAVTGGKQFDFFGMNSLFEMRGPPRPSAAARRPPPKGQTAAGRNFFFDERIARELDRLQDVSLSKQARRLAQLAAEVQARLRITKDATRRVTLEETLLGIQREQRSVTEQQADAQADVVAKIKAANQALKDRADAIKSAVIDRLQRKQTDVLNRRALREAQETLRVARYLGGKGAIRTAKERVADARFDILRSRVENAPASLTRGGQFSLGGVITININGVTDPAAVANRVAAILKKRGRHTTTSTKSAAPAAA